VLFTNVVVGVGGVISFAYRGAPGYDYEGDSNGLQLVSDPVFTVTNLGNGTMYYFEISAVNSSGQSAKSSQVSVWPLVLSVVSAMNRQFTLQFNGTDGQGYVVEMSTNFGRREVDAGLYQHAERRGVYLRRHKHGRHGALLPRGAIHRIPIKHKSANLSAKAAQVILNAVILIRD